MEGKVKFWSREKGWGFLVPDDGSEEVFVHHTAMSEELQRDLGKGDRVEFHVMMGPKGRKAVRVRALDNPYNTAA